MKKYIWLLILAVFAVKSFAQVEDTPLLVGKYFGNQSGGGAGYWQVSGNFTDESGFYDATNIAVGDVLFFSDSGKGYHLPIDTVISASGASFVVRVLNSGITGVAGVPNGAGAIYRPTTTKSLFPYTSGITSADQQTLNNYLIEKIEAISGGVSDGDKGDITVTSSGATWTIDNGVVSNTKLGTNAVDSTKAANLSPNDLAQTGASTNDVLTWTGTKYAPRPSTGGSGSPGGSTTQIQYNNAGAFDGDPKFYFNNTSKVLFVPKIEITDTTDNGTPAAAIRLNRTLSSSISSSGHGFRDQTVFSRPTFAYAAYDDAHTSAVNIDHSISFQGRNTHSAGTILDLQGAGMYPNLTGGSATNIKVYESKPVITGASTTATNLYGYNARTPGISGGATVSNYYAFFVENNAPSTNSYAFYQAAGSAPSQFTGTLNANFVGANIRLKADGTNANDGGFYVSSVGNLNFGNWDATKGFSVAGATGNITQLGSGTIQTGRIGINTTVHASAAINVSGTGIVSGLLTLNATGGNVRFKGANTTDGDGGLIATSGGDIYYSNWDINKGIVIKAGTGNINTLGFGKFGAGGVTTPTAMIHPAASTTSAASLRIPTGTAPTSPNEGDIWQTSNDLHFYTASTDAILARVLKGSATLDFLSTAAGASSSLTITVTGAATTDSGVSIQRTNAHISGTSYEAVITGTNTVTIYFHNFSALPQDPTSGTFNVTVTK